MTFYIFYSYVNRNRLLLSNTFLNMEYIEKYMNLQSQDDMLTLTVIFASVTFLRIIKHQLIEQ